MSKCAEMAEDKSEYELLLQAWPADLEAGNRANSSWVLGLRSAIKENIH